VPDLPLLRSAVIPESFSHGFTTRAGGVSAPPYDSLNLGRKWGDDGAHVEENRRRVLAASGVSVMCFARQVHGAAVVHVPAGATAADVARHEADALCSAAPGIAVAVFVADCVPALIADARTGAFAAVHAGWRGTLAGVIGATVTALAELGSRPSDLLVALGPAIGACCFEVGAEVAEPFRRFDSVVKDSAGAPRVDLRATLRLQLLAAGVPADAIDASAACTKCDPAGRFYSYRRDRGQTGQHLGFICRR
jgi:polyphenol oxidase